MSKIAVVGSRSFNDYELLSKTLNEFNNCKIISIISGGAKGADTLAEKYAKENKIPTEILKPDWNRRGIGAGLERNTDIINKADIVVAFWDGESKGTLDSIQKAKKEKKQLRIVEYLKISGYIEAYTDGSCIVSTRNGGWGWISYRYVANGPMIEWIDWGGEKDTTNNRMELTAMAELLEFLPKSCTAKIRSDSEHVLKGIVGDFPKKDKNDLLSDFIQVAAKPQGWLQGWVSSYAKIGAPDNDKYWKQQRKNLDLWHRIHQRILILNASGATLFFGWVKGHAKIKGNEIADKLANKSYEKLNNI